MENNKKKHGQFFTVQNPFTLTPFKEWFSLLPEQPKLLEPFAGSNNLVKMINETFGIYNWKSFDIEPPTNNVVPEVSVIQRDTLKKMPRGFDAIITNPPYLARNSATRAGIAFDEDNHYDDLYKYCLDKMLQDYDFVAAIIPESFITSGEFREKLFSIISLTKNMFNETDCPVCIAMFVPPKVKQKTLNSKDFVIYRLEEKIGNFSQIESYFLKLKDKVLVKRRCYFNDKDGKIGLRGVDNTIKNSIEFVDGNSISPELIKKTSRAITRISVEGVSDPILIKKIIDRSNSILEEYRKNTDDIFMTSFKGLRKDGLYRRRLDFKTAEEILNIALSEIIDESYEKFLPVENKNTLFEWRCSLSAR
ncbi:Eco57I restriction-modification methylase domain-containing protein [Candidatus Saccharibacteria bacterium]|nr:Eco57I restriction-modification methylase domain-containing protein [Candidatus Saccharibacteria bacterium]